MSIAFDPDRAGVLVDILVNDGQIIPVGQAIAYCAVDKEAYEEYIDAQRIAAIDAAKMEDADEAKKEKDHGKDAKRNPNHKFLLREIKHLIRDGVITADSGEMFFR
jgi:pyruvate/2-oxoglutarate dehydrogenase complex dihydrolipoamide acyltransferase (E2) component